MISTMNFSVQFSNNECYKEAGKKCVFPGNSSNNLGNTRHKQREEMQLHTCLHLYLNLRKTKTGSPNTQKQLSDNQPPYWPLKSDNIHVNCIPFFFPDVPPSRSDVSLPGRYISLSNNPYL